ncbi:MAG: hypothetical protein AB7I01_04325 [Gammaproteobacteria bacterium]
MQARDRESRLLPVSSTMPNANAGAGPARLDANKEDFISHPAQFPLHYSRRRSLMPRFLRRREPVGGTVGLSFHASEYIPAGTTLDLEIPLRGRAQRFTATVVLVRECIQGFDIGLWFANEGDAARARLVEKICHAECALRSRPAAHPGA